MQLRHKGLVLLALVAFAATAATVAWAASSHFSQAKAGVYDPAKTHLAQAGWIAGIGCPTNAGVSTTGGKHPNTTYTDPACTTGDRRDNANEGLLLAKTGPTANYAAGVADLNNVRGTKLTELGYDLRKPTSTTDPRGSHCGAGAPRFDVTLKDGTTYSIGCNSPPPDQQTAGNGWLRLRWGGNGLLLGYNSSGTLTNISGQTVKSIQIVFDEGQDTAPDNFGLAVLDNIDVNGTLVGHGNPPAGAGK
jgi:hypothetical protein